ncbi:hypothetical protein [Methyloglobulus sp.]|uniref:hypothetical protein n=1 Tax=Methyloglobulus sp. TaxID=2518622 RepID=UPI0039894EDE
MTLGRVVTQQMAFQVLCWVTAHGQSGDNHRDIRDVRLTQPTAAQSFDKLRTNGLC